MKLRKRYLQPLMEEVYVKGGQMLAGSDKSLKMNSQESTNEALSRGKNDAWGDEE